MKPPPDSVKMWPRHCDRATSFFFKAISAWARALLARAIIRAIANDDALEVPSPTYTLVQEYPLRLHISHLDLYRLSEPDELNELGIDEDADERVILVEWPERAGGALAANITISLSEAGEGRDARISG